MRMLWKRASWCMCPLDRRSGLCSWGRGLVLVPVDDMVFCWGWSLLGSERLYGSGCAVCLTSHVEIVSEWSSYEELGRNYVMD